MHKDIINILFSVFTGHINFTSGCYDHIHTQPFMQWPFFFVFKDSNKQLKNNTWNLW